MKQLNIQDIRAIGPCYDPIKYLSETWRGTVIDILKMSGVPAKDRLWVVSRPEFLNDQILHRYGLVCARQCEKYAADSDLKYCNDITEAYLDGHATREELSAAESAAWSAAESAARSAWSAAESAARSAARSARSATESAWSAAESAAWSATWSARSATESATESAWSAAREEQCLILIDLIERYS